MRDTWRITPFTFVDESDVANGSLSLLHSRHRISVPVQQMNNRRPDYRSWARLRVDSWRDSNRMVSQLGHESIRTDIRGTHLGQWPEQGQSPRKAPEPWVECIHFAGKLLSRKFKKKLEQAAILIYFNLEISLSTDIKNIEKYWLSTTRSRIMSRICALNRERQWKFTNTKIYCTQAICDIKILYIPKWDQQITLYLSQTPHPSRGPNVAK